MVDEKRSGFYKTVVGAMFVGSLVSSPVLAEDGVTAQDKWQFEIAPYLFAAGLDGTAGVRGIEADVEMGFDDILERLDKALFGYFTARKGNLVFAVDAIYFSIEDEESRIRQGPTGNPNTAELKADMTQQVYALSAGYRVLDGKTDLDVLGVARYTSLDAGLKLDVATGTDLLPDGSRSVGGKKGWWDGAIALRVTAAFAEKWAFMGYGDIGAGGSDLSYQLLAGLNWQFTDMFSTKLGYRYIYQDYQNDDFKWDMVASGAYLGFGVRW